ncbi:LysR family transcriptional regulator [Mumia zhuanghuii]|uniref:LysR family transcriptional regulator n=1 Tax=Mumia zhuanghuii TaxID=2585211 RepID=A0A5C4MR29_9ACTN|nr:LysR family transcriptional regulator [Mumia zhuanghuii]TNC46907.1 LysR family transcriptional regulator [Mumia zhuanghuii]TNC46956.1 LysR family transcriptional regulator [Mumia zhuanghuii]
MELQQLRYVVAVAETRSFTRAAQQCHVVQSALSHQVAKLEREIGARLFDRTSRRVVPTAAGEAFVPAAREALEAAERARAEAAAVSGVVSGRLRLGAIPTVTALDLPSLLRDFRDAHPRVDVSLRTDGSEELVARITTGSLDVALLGLPPGRVPQGVRSRVFGRDEHVAVVAPDHALAGENRTDLATLAPYPFVDFTAGTPGRLQTDQAFAAAGLERHVAFEVTTGDLAARLVAQRLGIALLPGAYAATLGGVRTVAIDDAPAREEHIAWSRYRPSPAAAAFLELVGLDTPLG